mgnify:CR=1 FL=1
MKEKKIFNAITDVRDEYIEEARTTRLQRQAATWKKWTAIVACLAMVIGIGGTLLLKNAIPFGGNTGTGGAGHDEGNVFMSYAGPIFPLTLDEKDHSMSATRDISYDFSLPNEDSLRTWGANVKDNYTLYNHSSEEKTIKAIYPFTGSFDKLKKLTPIITANGQELSPKLYAGGYSGKSTDVHDLDHPDGSSSTVRLDSWEGYKTLLEDGTYQSRAFAPYPLLSQQVTVYTFTDFEAPAEYHAATQAISFTIDPDKTTILPYGFEGGEFGDDGFRRYSYFVPNENSNRNQLKLLLVIGDDIVDYALQGYKNGACEKGNELDGVSTTVIRKEEILSQVMMEIIDNFFEQSGDGDSIAVSKEMFLGAVAEFIYEYGLLSESVKDRYQYSILEDILLETKSLQRVFYLELEMTVPPHENLLISAHMHKEPSFDFACSGSDKVGIQGYDMVTRLGSTLQFDGLTAELTSTDNIEILDQNYGFDLSQGITKVELDPMVEHYYLEIRSIEE